MTGKRAQVWRRLLAAPPASGHLVRLSSAAAYPPADAASYVLKGLDRGQAVVVFGSQPIMARLRRALRAAGRRLGELRASGQLVLKPSERTLALIRVDGTIDRDRFLRVVGRPIHRARAQYGACRALGDMVDLLCKERLDLALRLEQLWDELVLRERIPLLCLASIDCFDRESYRGAIERMAGAHSHLMPVDDPERFDTAVDTTLRAVFGEARSEARRLLGRLLRARSRRRRSWMPRAEASLLGVCELFPQLGSLVLDQARRGYQTPGQGAEP